MALGIRRVHRDRRPAMAARAAALALVAAEGRVGHSVVEAIKQPKINFTYQGCVPAMNNWLIDWGGTTERLVAWLYFKDDVNTWYVCPATATNILNPYDAETPPYTLVPPL